MEELEKLKEIIANVLSLDPNEIHPDMTFLEDLGADSLDVFQIIVDLEDAFDVSIPQEQAEKISTVGQAAEMIKKATSEKS
ncbi:MAG: acyl carrier protein [Lachnospiraceae bacterium]|nr:acyl carrier protein [Lachnospiraceae bacterium]